MLLQSHATNYKISAFKKSIDKILTSNIIEYCLNIEPSHVCNAVVFIIITSVSFFGCAIAKDSLFGLFCAGTTSG